MKNKKVNIINPSTGHVLRVNKDVAALTVATGEWKYTTKNKLRSVLKKTARLLRNYEVLQRKHITVEDKEVKLTELAKKGNCSITQLMGKGSFNEPKGNIQFLRYTGNVINTVAVNKELEKFIEKQPSVNKPLRSEFKSEKSYLEAMNTYREKVKETMSSYSAEKLRLNTIHSTQQYTAYNLKFA